MHPRANEHKALGPKSKNRIAARVADPRLPAPAPWRSSRLSAFRSSIQFRGTRKRVKRLAIKSPRDPVSKAPRRRILAVEKAFRAAEIKREYLANVSHKSKRRNMFGVRSEAM
ncbi:hypothetical protein KM043_016227 [Ampulex compressa]|nr:hypothetical protein KM043_016227 [Ampulex compressa]